MKLAIIAAIAKNRVIGNDGKLPWHISEDLRRFKKLTTGHVVLMGRKTYESLERPLPNRRNVVLTARSIPEVETFRTLATALKALKDEEVVFVIGGGTVFSQTLELADELFLTLVDQEVEGDAFFPPYEHLLRTSFHLIAREEHNGFAFLNYSRIPTARSPSR